MSWTDPSIELVACGENGLTDWDRIVVEGLADQVRWHSIHIYTGSDEYWTNVLTPHQAERALRRVKALIDDARYRQRIAHPVHVAYDEWNVWFREREEGLEERYTLADALAVATYVHIFVRHCQVVRMANLAQLVNVIAPIVTRPDGLFLQTIYHPLRLFAEHLRPVALDVHVDCDTHDLVEVVKAPGGWPHRVSDLGPFPVLDVTASIGERGEGLTLSVVNRSPTDAVDAQLRFADAFEACAATVERVAGPDPEATNSFEDPDRVGVETEQLDALGERHRPALSRPLTHRHHLRQGGHAMTAPLSRRGFFTTAGGAAAMLLTGCSGTYDVASGFFSSDSGSGKNTIVYWNLLSGGDGSHMQEMEATYRKEHPEITLDSTVLVWGNPYYTKLAMATRAGSAPDVAIMHLTRLHQFAPAELLKPLDLDLLAAHGMTPADFTPLAFAKAHYNGQLLAIPLDTHPFVQYYNTKVCRRAGLLNSAGELPPITGPEQLLAALRRLKAVGVTPAVCDQIDDPATPWRLFYTFYSQAGGEVLADNGTRLVLDRPLALRVLSFIGQLGREGLLSANTDAAGGITLFQSGDVGLYWEGEWNVDIFQQAGLPFSCPSACSRSRRCSAPTSPRPTRTRSSSPSSRTRTPNGSRWS